MRAAAYLRVSTDEQTTANQRPDIERAAALHGWTVTRWHADEAVSGTKTRRPGLDALMEDVAARRVEAVIVWKLDRLGRSLPHVVSLVQRLDAAGVALVSATEAWLDTSGPTRDLLIGIFAWVAQYERRTLVERTRAGLARARAEGVKLGRPKGAKDSKPRKRRR